MSRIATCTECSSSYEAGSEEQADELCPSCRRKANMADPHRIILMLDDEEFTPDGLAAIRVALSRAERRHEIAEKRRMAACAPEELLPDWGCYDCQDAPAAVAALNEAGAALARAIRSSGRDEIEEAMRQVLNIQEEWAQAGANDTEGRAALWELVRNACAATAYDPVHLWERYYS